MDSKNGIIGSKDVSRTLALQCDVPLTADQAHAGKKLCHPLTLSAPLVFCAEIATAIQNLSQAATLTQHLRYSRCS